MHELRLGERQRPVRINQQMPIRRRDMNGAGCQLVPLPRLTDGQPCTAAENLCHQAAMPRVQMLDDHNGGREVAGQVAQHRAQSSHASGRGGNRDGVVSPGNVPAASAALINWVSPDAPVVGMLARLVAVRPQSQYRPDS